MKKVGYIVLCVVILLAVFFISNVELISADSEEYPLPDDGKWISDDGSIVLSFDEEDYYSKIVVDGNTVQCTVSQENHSPDVYLVCLEFDNPDYSRGDIVFHGTIKEITDDSFSIITYKNKKTYVFTKLE